MAQARCMISGLQGETHVFVSETIESWQIRTSKK